MIITFRKNRKSLKYNYNNLAYFCLNFRDYFFNHGLTTINISF